MREKINKFIKNKLDNIYKYITSTKIYSFIENHIPFFIKLEHLLKIKETTEKELNELNKELVNLRRNTNEKNITSLLSLMSEVEKRLVYCKLLIQKANLKSLKKYKNSNFHYIYSLSNLKKKLSSLQIVISKMTTANNTNAIKALTSLLNFENNITTEIKQIERILSVFNKNVTIFIRPRDKYLIPISLI
jgi:hypothetical protein